MTTELVHSIVDSWIWEARPNNNYGLQTKLGLDNNSVGVTRRTTELGIPRTFPLGATVSSALLHLRLLGVGWAGSHTISARRITSPWKERRVTWGNRPSVSVIIDDIAVVDGTDGDLVTLDLTALFQSVAAGFLYYGVQLLVDTSGIKNLYSTEHPDADLHPYLEVTYSMSPAAPSELAPSGGRIISLTDPTLLWSFRDFRGENVQQSFQVLISEDEAFTEPVFWDSGVVASEANEYDLSTEGLFPGLGLDTYFWKVQATDDQGLVSDYSDAQSFTRTAKGAVAITSPGATVGDLTPPITHTFSGTQEATAYSIFQSDADGNYPRDPKWYRPRQATSDLTVTPPDDIIVHASPRKYKVLVHVWDVLDREAMPGDLLYVEAEQEFEYVRSGVPLPVETLTASQNGPAVTLEWTRTAEPDHFALKVDGVVVASRIEPADVLVSGTTYALDYYAAQPDVQHTYEVEAVVDSAGDLQHSDGNATEDFTSVVTGVWLVDTSDGTAVKLRGSNTPQLFIGEEGATYMPVGRRDPVRIVESIRGYEGRVVGVLMNDSGVTPATWKARLERIKGRAGATSLRLVIANDMNIPVSLGAVSISRQYELADFDVEFDVWQSGEYAFEVTG